MQQQRLAYSYVRWSRPEQARGDSLRRQTEAARRYAVERGLALQDTDYRDAGVSGFRGKNRDVGALGAFVRAVEDGAIPEGSFLLVENLDRLSRESALVAAGKLQEICNAGITVVTLSDRREYTAESLRSDTGAILSAVIGFIVAHEHSAKLRQRLQEVNAAKRQAARSLTKPSTARTPPWIRLVDRSKAPPHCFELDEARAAVVHRIFDRAAAGASAYTIARELNTDGLPTFEGARSAKHAGRPRLWIRPYLAKLLRSETVLGTYAPMVRQENGSRLPDEAGKAVGYYPAVVSRVVWEAAQRAHAPSGPRGRHAGSPVVNVLGGLCRCGRCGAGVRYQSKGNGKAWLMCSAAKVGKCMYTALPYGAIEQLIVAVEPWANAGAGEDMDWLVEESRNSVLGLQQTFDSLIEELPRHTPAVQARLRRKADKVAHDLAGAEREYQAILARAEVEQPAVVRARCEALRAALTAAPIDRTAANVCFRQLLSKAEFRFDLGVLRLHWRHGGAFDVFFGIREKAA